LSRQDVADFRGFRDRPKSAQPHCKGTDRGYAKHDQAGCERTVREKLLVEIEEHGLRTSARFLGVDASNLVKMVSGKRKLTPGRLGE
jgi:hypothetical protein